MSTICDGLGFFPSESIQLSRRVLRDDALQSRFDDAGYVIVPLLDADEVDALREGYWTAANVDGGVNPEGAYNDTYAEFSVIHSRPDFRRTAFELISSKLTDPANEWLQDYRPLVANYVNKPPGTGVVPAHQNWSVVDESRFQSVSVWVALVDCVVENGTMLMCDGSHHRLRGPRGMWAYQAYGDIEAELIDGHLTPVFVRAGDAVILDDAVVHYSPPNATDVARLAIQFVMVPEEADAVFFQQVGEHDGIREVDVWKVEPPFFFEFWHGDGDAAHGEVIDHIEVAVPPMDIELFRSLVLDEQPAVAPEVHDVEEPPGETAEAPPGGTADAPSTPARRWWRRRRRTSTAASAPEPFELRTVRLAASEAGEHPDLLQQLNRREVDAVLVRDVLDPDEVERAVRGLDEVLADAPAEMFGHVLGMPLMRLGDGDADRSPYYDSTATAREQYRAAFGLDPHDRVVSVLSQMAGSWDVAPPTEDGRSYSGGTARWYLPGQGGLYPHVGNEFVEQNEHGALTHLLTLNQVRDWISWFMVLQRPESGGELTVYDLLHAERPPDFDDPALRERTFRSIRSVELDPAPGELIAFCGGWRYHRVEQIGGTRARMTYGGFMKPDRQDRCLHMWA